MIRQVSKPFAFESVYVHKQYDVSSVQSTVIFPSESFAVITQNDLEITTDKPYKHHITITATYTVHVIKDISRAEFKFSPSINVILGF